MFLTKFKISKKLGLKWVICEQKQAHLSNFSSMAKNSKKRKREKNGRKGEVFYWNISSSNRQRRQVKKVIKLTKTRDKTRHSKAKKNRKLKDKKKKLSLTYSKSRIPKGLTDQFFWVWGGGGGFSVVPIRWNVV